jgi:hypothetical protein
MTVHFEIEKRDGTMVPIKDPVGWDSTILMLDRDKDKHGLFFSYQANEFEYLHDAAAILQEEHDTYGTEGLCYLHMVFECDGETDSEEVGKFDFTSWEDHFGDDCSVKLPMENAGDIMTFRNRIDQKVDLQTALAFDGTTALSPYAKLPFNIDLPGKSIFAQDKAIMDTISDLEYQDAIGTSNVVSAIFVPPFEVIVSSEIGGFNFPTAPAGTGTINAEFEWARPNTFTAPADWVQLPYECEVGTAGTELNKVPLFAINPCINYAALAGNTFNNTPFTGDLTINIPVLYFNILKVGGVNVVDAINGAGFYMAKIDRYDNITWFPQSPGALLSGDFFDVYKPSPPGTASIGIAAAGTVTGLTMNTGDRIVLFCRINFTKNFALTSDAPFEIQVSTPNSFIYEGLSAVPTTENVKGFMANEAFSRVVEAITDDRMRVYSDYFGRTDAEPYASASDGCGSLEMLTTGLFIRKIEDLLIDRPPIFSTSFKDLWDGFNPIHNLGIGMEDDPNRPGNSWLRVEPWSYFYDDSVVMSCLGITNLKRTIRADKHYSIFKFGYEKWEAEEFNGIDEFLTQRGFRTTLTQINNTLTQISKFIGSGFALEITRRLGNTTSQDWRYDKEVFVVCLKRDGSDLVVELGGITSPDHIVDPDTIYNFRIRPAYNAMRWLPTVLASYRQADVNSPIIFTDGTGNFYAEGKPSSSFCRISNVVVSEMEDLKPSLMVTPADGLPINWGEDIDYSYPLTFKEWKTLKANPNKKIEYEADGISGYGWINSVKYKPEDGIADFKLIPQIV